VEAAHRWLAIVLIAVCVVAAVSGGVLYRRGRPAGPLTAHLLSLAQTLLVAQVAVGLLLLAGDRHASGDTHYLYGALALGAVLTPWFYAAADGPRRLLWFAGTSGLAAALAVRALMTGGM
jgi:hypothetical protein